MSKEFTLARHGSHLPGTTYEDKRKCWLHAFLLEYPNRPLPDKINYGDKLRLKETGYTILRRDK